MKSDTETVNLAREIFIGLAARADVSFDYQGASESTEKLAVKSFRMAAIFAGVNKRYAAGENFAKAPRGQGT